MPLLPGAQPFDLPGSGALARVGALLLHGFTGNPSSMRPWGEALAAAGVSVLGPRLPGHGTRWQELQVTRWPDWYAEAERGLATLGSRCDLVVVMGLSMGATLALRLAEEHGEEIAGVVTVNASLATERRDAPLLPLLAKVLPSLAGVGGDIAKPGVQESAYPRLPLKAAASLAQLWQVTRADLGRITAPLLVFRSRVDHVVEPLSGRLLLAGVSSTDVEERILENSFHVATLDYDAPLIVEGSLEFLRRLAGTPAAAPTASGQP